MNAYFLTFLANSPYSMFVVNSKPFKVQVNTLKLFWFYSCLQRCWLNRTRIDILSFGKLLYKLKTIDFDCSGTYHITALQKIDLEIKNLNAKDIRSKIKVKADKDIDYHIKQHEADVKRCEEHNQWYEDFIKNL